MKLPAINNKWYDLVDDWELIEASFATQYNLRFKDLCEMQWSEFCTLLSGIMYKTPLGQIVSIRAEEDKEIIKNFTKEQKEIRNSWRNKMNEEIISKMSDADKLKKVQEIHDILKNAFGQPT